jgi:hypothetical protein
MAGCLVRTNLPMSSNPIVGTTQAKDLWLMFIGLILQEPSYGRALPAERPYL